MAKRSLKNKIEEESKIEFRGEKMKLSDAKIYLSKLEKGEINLEYSESEINEAKGFMDSMKRCDMKAGIKEAYFHNYDEREYFSMILGMRINLQEKFDKENYCKKKGHIGEKVLSCDSSGRALCYCPKCGDMYDRPMNPQESRDFNELIRTPMTI
jgi:hypothetical protein